VGRVGSGGRGRGNERRTQAGPGGLARRSVGATGILGAVVLAVAAAR